jgi:hypothetical protein
MGIRGCIRAGVAVLALTALAVSTSARAAEWKISPAVRVTAAVSRPATLSAVSCPSATECVAVGSYLDSTGNPSAGPLVEMSNGPVWTIQSTPPVSGGGLMGVSCPSVSECIAVGTIDRAGSSAPLAELWNGTNWSVQRGAGGPGGQGALEGVSCSRLASCMAVGEGLMPSGATADPTEVWNGSTWTAEPVPSFVARGTTLQVARLSGVSCAPTGACDAVGYHPTYGDQGTEVVTAEWDGSAWSDQQEPASIQTNAQLSAVSCAAATACEAVGSEAEGWDGSVWSRRESSLPAGGFLDGNSCPAPAACVAVGDQSGNSGKMNGVFADTFDGADWTETSIATPGLASLPQLAGISCVAATSCTAVGSDTDAAGVSVPLILTDSANRWTPEATPSLSVPDPSSRLAAVSCGAPGSCLAVGIDAGGVLTLRLHRGRVSSPTAPNPGDGADNVGEPMSSTTSAMTEQWSGFAWRYQPHQPRSPAQGGGDSPDNELTGLSCSSRQRCTAVGSATTGGNCGRCGNLAERFDGERWSLQRPSQAATTRGNLQSVACPSATRCVAVGAGAAQVWNGTGRALTRIHGSLTSVSCPTTRHCVAVGTDANRVLVERWNGVGWVPQPAPNPRPATGITVTGVSCPTVRACVLVGSERTRGHTVSLIVTYR